MSGTENPSLAAGPAATLRRRANGWPVLPMRLFFAALFMFAGYAKLSYPGFLSANSPSGFKASVDAVKHGTPIGGALGPLSDHPSLFGHVTAFAEIAIGLGLLVGLLTRIAALGGMVLTVMIALSIDWGGIKQYTGSSGWFTSVDFAVAAALSVFLIGGADPFSLDALIWRSRLRRRARDDAEPGFRDNEFEESRQRLQGQPSGYTAAGAGGSDRERAYQQPAADGGWVAEHDQRTQQLPPLAEDDPTSLWNSGRTEPDRPNQPG
jgi:thiosulfate dehydrogenase [quinone] large subunit